MEKIFFDIDPYTFTGSAVIIGLLLTQELSANEQDSVGNWLQLIGLVMQTYSSQVITLEAETDKEENDLETVKKTIKKIQERLEKIEKDTADK